MSSPSKRVLTLRVPESVVSKLKEVLSEKDFKNSLHFYLWPVHLILERQSFNTDVVFNKNDGFVFLNSEKDIKKGTGGSRYSHVIRTLKGSGIIYCRENEKGTERYVPEGLNGDKGETKAYALGDKFLLDRIVEHRVVKKKFIKSINEVQQGYTYQPKNPLEKYLKKSFKSYRMNAYAETYCELKRNLTLLREAVRASGSKDHKQLHKLTPHIIDAIEGNGHTVEQVLNELECIKPYKAGRYATDFMQIKQFREGEIFFKAVINGGRIFTTANLMSRDLRAFLEHSSGEKLFEADISNSQPLMLCGLLKEHYKDNWPDDAIHYKNLCTTGWFYEHMYKVTRESKTEKQWLNFKRKLVDGVCDVIADGMTEEERIAYKKKMFGHIFYCDLSKFDKLSGMAALFNKEFPDVYRFICEYKIQYGYKALPIAMQKVEKEIIIDAVCGQLKKSNVRPITVHDSIIVTESEIDQLMHLLKSTFDSQLKLSPSIKKKAVAQHDLTLYKRYDYIAYARLGVE